MADEELVAPDALPPRAGYGSFLGLKPQDWLAALGGILGGVPLGRGPLSQNIRPFGALFPIAQGVENADQRVQQRAGVEALQSQYGGETDLPEFKTAILLANQGHFKEAMALLGRGIGDRNTRARELRLANQTGEAAEQWGRAQAPVKELGVPALPESPQVGQEDDYVPAVPGTPDVDRAPTVPEMMAKLDAIVNPTIRGLAYGKADATFAKRNEEDLKLRPKTTVHGDRLIREDPRRGTATFDSELPETLAQRGIRGQREARTAELDALTAKHQRPAPPTPGSQARPHFWKDTGEPDGGGPRQLFEFRSYTKVNPNAPGGYEQVTERRPTGVNKPWRPFAPKDGGTKESIWDEDVITPSRPITAPDSFKRIDADVQGVVNEVAGNLKSKGVDFNVPGGFVTLPSGQKISKEDAIAAAFRLKHKVDVTVRWDGTRFRLVTAKTLKTKENRQHRRITGPAGTIGKYDPQESDDTEEE